MADDLTPFTIHFRDGRQTVIRAEVLHPPYSGRHFYTLEVQGEPVAEFHRDAVMGWSRADPVKF